MLSTSLTLHQSGAREVILVNQWYEEFIGIVPVVRGVIYWYTSGTGVIYRYTSGRRNNIGIPVVGGIILVNQWYEERGVIYCIGIPVVRE